jgi:Zn-dependent protease
VGSPDDDARRVRDAANLRAVYEHLQRPAAATTPVAAPVPDTGGGGSARRRTALGALVASLLGAAGKLKALGALVSVLQLKTFVSMLLSVGMYATEWGWPFATGFVLLIFVHELGHWIVLRGEGIDAGAPVFIPFVGAFITMREQPRDAYVEAKVAIGGPVLGSIGAWAVLAVGLATESPLLAALGHTGILINLFNLVPLAPLDGGRIAGAFTRPYWVAGYALGVAALVWTKSPILFLGLVTGLWTLQQRWRNPVRGYHDIPRWSRLLIGCGYGALVLALIATMPLGHAMATRPRAGGGAPSVVADR